MNIERQKKIDRILGLPLLVVLKPIVTALGWLLRRDHALRPHGRIVVVKMLGGGSLVVAFPALLGLRRAYPGLPIVLITSTSIASFARTLGIFDSILSVDSQSMPRLLWTTFRSLARVWRADCALDLEVHSKLTTVFSLLTCARNRLGFYLESVQWRRPVQTHLVFFNRSAPAHIFYERLTALLGAEPPEYAECRAHLRYALEIADKPLQGVAVGVGCSNLSRERMLDARQWLAVIRERLNRDKTLSGESLVFLGSAEDHALAEEILRTLAQAGLPFNVSNLCGALALPESLRIVAAAREYWGIDSALLHYARLLGTRSVSFWGPTSPHVLLKPYPIDEQLHYSGIPCSPCVHVTEFPPCAGRNLCMTSLLRPLTAEELGSLPPVIHEDRR